MLSASVTASVSAIAAPPQPPLPQLPHMATSGDGGVPLPPRLSECGAAEFAAMDAATDAPSATQPASPPKSPEAAGPSPVQVVHRPCNAYFLFCRKRRPELIARHGQMDMPEISKMLGKEWAKMKAPARQPYVGEAQRLKEAYDAVPKDHKAERKDHIAKKRTRSPEHSSGSGEDWKGAAAGEGQTKQQMLGKASKAAKAEKGGAAGGKEEPAPASSAQPQKRPPNAYILWCGVRRKQLSALHPELKMPEISKMLGTEWRTLPAAQKAPFTQKAEELKAAYDEQPQHHKLKYRPRSKKAASAAEAAALLLGGMSGGVSSSTQAGAQLRVQQGQSPERPRGIGGRPKKGEGKADRAEEGGSASSGSSDGDAPVENVQRSIELASTTSSSSMSEEGDSNGAGGEGGDGAPLSLAHAIAHVASSGALGRTDSPPLPPQPFRPFLPPELASIGVGSEMDTDSASGGMAIMGDGSSGAAHAFGLAPPPLPIVRSSSFENSAELDGLLTDGALLDSNSNDTWMANPSWVSPIEASSPV